MITFTIIFTSLVTLILAILVWADKMDANMEQAQQQQQKRHALNATYGRKFS
jgi:Tfp pilus assembly protein PilO